MKRIPIETGFSISVTSEGRPLSYGEFLPDAVAAIERWLERNQEDRNATAVRIWHTLAAEYLVAEEAEEVKQKKRTAIDKDINSKLGPIRKRWPELEEVIKQKAREERYKQAGLQES